MGLKKLCKYMRFVNKKNVLEKSTTDRKIQENYGMTIGNLYAIAAESHIGSLLSPQALS
jgi:hypothetical protein